MTYSTTDRDARLRSTEIPAGRYLLLLAASMFALLVFRLMALRGNATDLFFDEAQYWSWSL